MRSILQHELKHYFKNIQEAIYIYSYFISVILLISFASRSQISEIQGLAPVSLWVALASAIALGAAGLFKRDYDQGRLEYYQLLPITMEVIIFAKWVSFLVFVLVPLLAILPIAGLLFNLSATQLAHYAIGLGVGSAALSVVSTLVAANTAGMGKAGAILSLVILPLTIPVMIFGSEYCRDSTSLWQPNLLFLVGFTIFLLPVMCIAGAYSIRASN